MTINIGLLSNIDSIHTTELGLMRIRRNLGLSHEVDAVAYCKEIIKSADAIERRGKNWYAHIGDVIITVNASSLGIITAHREKPKE